MNPHTIEVDWEHAVPVDEVRQFRDTHAAELEGYYGAGVRTLSDYAVARYMVRISHPSPRYLKAGMADLVFGR